MNKSRDDELRNEIKSFVLALCCFIMSTSAVLADALECGEQTAPAAFLEQGNVLCLQKITIAGLSGSVSYKAALQWSGADNPNEFRLISVDADLAGGESNPVFSTENGTLTLSKVDIPKLFGTERYTASLALVDPDELSVFQLTSVAVYINPDYVPNETWKPYGMLAAEERRAVDLLGRSIPYAMLADAIYDFDNTVVGQWVLVDKKDKNSGMQAGVYHNQETDELILAFRGTDTCDFPCSLSESAEFVLDSTADGLLVLGLVDTQFEDAMDYAQDVISRAQGRKISVTGHSLGGALAQAVSAALGLEAFVFNSAPVPDDFFKDYPPAFSADVLSEMIHVIADIHDPVSNTDEASKLYVDADHVSTLLQFDFDLKEVLPEELGKLNDLKFDRHSMTRLLDNAVSLLSIYRDGW